MSSRDPDKTGEFPFPLTESARESKYLIWLRNHANYLSVSGISDYFRAIGILVRGVLANFLIFLPYLLAVSLAVSLAKITSFPDFLITKILAGVFVAWILVFSLLTPVYRISKYRLMRSTGSDSDVASRDWYERTFGYLLLAILVAAAVESLPVLLDYFQWQKGWPGIASSIAVAAAVFSAFPKLVSLVGEGLARQLALIAVGALGLIVPLVVVLFFAKYLLLGQSGDLMPLLILAVLVFPLLVILPAAFFGFRQRAFSLKDWLFSASLVVATILLFMILNRWDDFSYDWIEGGIVNAAAANLVENPDDREGLSAYLAEHQGPRMGKLHGSLNRPPEPASDTDFGENHWLGQLVTSAEGAGLYPEFGGVVTVIRNSDCVTDRSRTDCDQFWSDVRDLQAAAETVRVLVAEKSLEKRADKILGMSAGDVSGLENTRGKYSALAAEFSEIGTCDENTEAEGLEKDCFQIILRSLGTWHPEISKVRVELITSASTLLPDLDFYESSEATRLRQIVFTKKFVVVLIIAVELWFFLWLTVDINLTSIHGMYRDRLATAFLIGEDTGGSVDIERDLDLMEICRYDEGSIAPYHLINVALNLQASEDIGLRDRNSDFFIFSRRFIGGKRTGYCQSETMEQIFPQMDLATAMAISAAAASPNMGRATTPALVAIMTLLNVRLGYWVPNPGQLEDWLDRIKGVEREGDRNGFSEDEVFAAEFNEIKERWTNVYGEEVWRDSASANNRTIEKGLVGIGYSGGGIRSATLNLGITQVLHARGVFDHIDYMSTVSGGGYLGSSISALMRRMPMAPTQSPEPAERADQAAVAEKIPVLTSIGQIFRWRVRPGALLKEILGRLDEKGRWVNVSDGGHIENMASIELLRRKCRFIIIGDAEADPGHRFNGLATLVRTARIDLGIDIDIKADPLRVNEQGLSKEHWAIGQIRYLGQEEPGYLLYLKSSVTGDEDEVIKQYRSTNSPFPHETTADQFFNEGQFEAYRSLGQHIAEQLINESELPAPKGGRLSFADFESWFQSLWENRRAL